MNQIVFPKCPVLHMYLPYTITQTLTQKLVSKLTSLTCVNTLYNNTNTNTEACCQNEESYLSTYPLQQNNDGKHGIVSKITIHNYLHTL